MAWGVDAQKLVFQLSDEGKPEKDIIREIRQQFHSDDKTVRRCLAGLDLLHEPVTEQLEPEGPLHKRFHRYGGTDHYLAELRRAYRANNSADLQLSAQAKNLKPISAIDAALFGNCGISGGIRVFAEIVFNPKCAMRLDKLELVVNGAKVAAELIPKPLLEKRENFTVLFPVPHGLAVGVAQARVVASAVGREFESAPFPITFPG